MDYAKLGTSILGKGVAWGVVAQTGIVNQMVGFQGPLTNSVVLALTDIPVGAVGEMIGAMLRDVLNGKLGSLASEVNLSSITSALQANLMVGKIAGKTAVIYGANMMGFSAYVSQMGPYMGAIVFAAGLTALDVFAALLSTQLQALSGVTPKSQETANQILNES